MIRDSFLSYSKDTGEVSLTKLGGQLNCFKALEKADDTKSKILFGEQLKVLYYHLSPDSPYLERYTPGQRKSIIYEQHINKRTQKQIETPEYKICEKVMLRHNISREEAQLEQCLADFDSFLEYLKTIPWEREIVETTTEGKKQKSRSYKISNVDERLKAVKAISAILSLQKELEAIVSGKQITTKTNSDVNDFEDPAYIESLNRQISQMN
jgi:hypothetical protein